MVLRRVSFFMLVGLSFLAGYSQTGLNLKGKITNQKGEPVEYASIGIKGTTIGTSTNEVGEFELDGLKSGDYVLIVSSLGYRKYEKPVTIDPQSPNIQKLTLSEDYLSLDQVIISATRTELDRKEAPIVVNVVNDKLLQATQSVTLSEGLSFQPALRIENNCQNCGFNGLRMNGLEGAYSQILVDGRPIFNSLQGVYGLEQIPANMIERVEIVRSGGSALYGSSAVAGTVNIITREPNENQYYFTSNLSLINGESPDRTYMVGSDILSKNEKSGLSIYGFHRNRDHWDANGDNFSEIGEMDSKTFGFKSFYKPSRYSKLTFQGFSMYEYRRGGNRFNFPVHEADIAESTTHNILNGGFTFEQYSKNFKHKISIYSSLQHTDRDSYYGAGKDPNAYGNTLDKSWVSGIQYSTDLETGKAGIHTLVTGVETNRNNLQDNAPAYDRIIDQQANQFGWYLQDNWQINDRWNLLLGGRLDQHNLLTNPVISPRANILYDISESVQFRVGYARGFRAPQVFDEDLHITQVGGEGTIVRNDNGLNAEYSNAYSSSIDFNRYSRNWALGITIDGFITSLNDVFILEEVNDPADNILLLIRTNGEGALVGGFTINPKVSYKEKINFQAAVTYQKSRYDVPVEWSESVPNTSRRFFRTPDLYGFYALSLVPNDRFNINFSGIYTGPMIAQHYGGYISEDRLESTEDFLENNFKAEYIIPIENMMKLSLSAGVQNYTNAFQQDFDRGIDRDAGYIYGPGRPRTIFMGISLKI